MSVSRREFLKRGKGAAFLGAGAVAATALLQRNVPSAHAVVDGSGTVGRIPKWTGTTVIGDSILSDTGTNINPDIDNSRVLGDITKRWSSIKATAVDSGAADLVLATTLAVNPVADNSKDLGTSTLRWREALLSRHTKSPYWNSIFYDLMDLASNASFVIGSGSPTIAKKGLSVRLQSGTAASANGDLRYETDSARDIVDLANSEFMVYVFVSRADSGSRFFLAELAKDSYGGTAGTHSHFGVTLDQVNLFVGSGNGTTGSEADTGVDIASGSFARIRVRSTGSGIEVYVATGGGALPTTPNFTKTGNLPTGRADRYRLIVSHSGVAGGNNEVELLSGYIAGYSVA